MCWPGYSREVRGKSPFLGEGAAGKQSLALLAPNMGYVFCFGFM